MSLQEGGDQLRRSQPENLTQLLLRLKDRHPQDTKDERKERFRNHALDLDEKFLSEALDFWYSVHWKRILEPTPTAPPKPPLAPREKAAAEAKRAQEERDFIETGKAKIVANILEVHITMALSMKFGDCAKYAKGDDTRAWFGAVAKLGKPNQVVGKVLTKEQLRKVKA